MRVSIATLFVFLISIGVMAQVQVINTQTYSTPEAAATDLPYVGKPIALIPTYVRRDGTNWDWELMTWTTIYAPNNYGNNCEIYPNVASSIPQFGYGALCHGAGLGNPQTSVYPDYNSGYVAFMAKTPLQRQSCMLVAEPGMQVFTWMTAPGQQRYWLTCQEGFFAYSC